MVLVFLPNFCNTKSEKRFTNALFDFGFINLYFGETSTLSSCCFDGNQKILTKSSNGVELTNFYSLLNQSWESNRRNFTVYHNGSWCSAKTLKIPINNKKMFKVITIIHMSLKQKNSYLFYK